ncbi:MAG TPA: Ku protein [Pseudolabrys sp.]|nr:Ku protein [Pseudolabrys sp.]
MAPRPNWKGYLKLSLVSCSVALYPATSTSQRIRFNIINRNTGNRIRNDVVDAETGEPVEREDRVKGYQFEKGQYVLVDEEELDNVALESTHTIDIEQFVPMAEVDRIYLDESYYLVPQDDMSQEAFAVIREAMRKEDLVGVARVVISRREHLLLLAPRGKGLMATTLRYKTEVRAEKNYFDDIEDIKVAPDMLKLATQILDSKKGKFDPSKFEDRYENALMDLINAKRAGKAPPVISEERPSNVVNLMDALRRSARGESGRSGKASSHSSSSRSSPRKSKSSGPRRKRTTSSKRKVRKAG